MNVQQPECAAKPVHGSPPTPDWQTSTSNMSNTSMIGASKSLPTAWHSGVELNWQWMPPLVSPLTRAGEPPTASRSLCRSSTHRCTQSQRTGLPRTPSQFEVPPCRLRHRSGRPLSEEAASFITSLARTKTRDTPAPLRHAAATSLISRWTAFLTHAAMTAFAASLLFEDPTHHHNLDGEPPSLSDLLAQLPPDPTHPSRLPPHPP